MAIAIQLRASRRYAMGMEFRRGFHVPPAATPGPVMSIASTWRFGIVLLLAGLMTSPLGGQVKIFKQGAAGNGLVFQRVQRHNCDFGVAQFNGVMIVCEQQTGEQPPENKVPPDRDPSRQVIQVTFRKGNLDQVIYGNEQDEAGARGRLAMTLHWKISAIDRACELNGDQIEKLRLAGRGDIKRLVDRASDIRARFEDTDAIRDVDEFEKWATTLAAESDVLRLLLSKGPFDADSLFAKAVKRTLTPEQTDQIARTRDGSLIGVDIVRTKLSLDEILNEWERAAARRARLDCDFTRIRYDTKSGIEFRGQGSLAVDRHGRGAYRLEPAEIPQGAPGAKRGPGGVACELRAENPDRWHWTGISVIRVNEKNRTFAEWRLPGRAAEEEFQPDPPELPEEAVLPKPRRPIRNPLAPKPPLPRGSRTALAGQVSRLLGGIMLSRVLSQEDFAVLIDLLEKFELAQPFL